MVNYIKEVSAFHTHISSMTLYFKMDKQSRIWLLFCSNLVIKTQKRDAALFSKNVLAQINNARRPSPIFKYHLANKDHDRKKRVQETVLKTSNGYEHRAENTKHCSVCLKFGSLNTIDFRQLQKSFRNDPTGLKNLLVRLMDKKDNEEKFSQILKNATAFEKLECRVCDDCYCNLTRR